jgi:hypothetical protein
MYYSKPVIEILSTDAPLPRVVNDIAHEVDPTYLSKTMNPGQRRRLQAKAKKQAEQETPNDVAPAPAVQAAAPIQHSHGTRSKKAPPRTFFNGGMSIPTQEANLMSSAIGELFLHSTNAVLPNLTWQANAAATPNSGSALQYNQLLKGPDREHWIRATANEIARLAQGLQGGPTGTNTMFFIPHTAIPADRKATSDHFVNDNATTATLITRRTNSNDSARENLDATGEQLVGWLCRLEW